MSSCMEWMMISPIDNAMQMIPDEGPIIDLEKLKIEATEVGG